MTESLTNNPYQGPGTATPGVERNSQRLWRHWVNFLLTILAVESVLALVIWRAPRTALACNVLLIPVISFFRARPFKRPQAKAMVLVCTTAGWTWHLQFILFLSGFNASGQTMSILRTCGIMSVLLSLIVAGFAGRSRQITEEKGASDDSAVHG